MAQDFPGKGAAPGWYNVPGKGERYYAGGNEFRQSGGTGNTYRSNVTNIVGDYLGDRVKTVFGHKAKRDHWNTPEETAAAMADRARPKMRTWSDPYGAKGQYYGVAVEGDYLPSNPQLKSQPGATPDPDPDPDPDTDLPPVRTSTGTPTSTPDAPTGRDVSPPDGSVASGTWMGGVRPTDLDIPAAVKSSSYYQDADKYYRNPFSSEALPGTTQGEAVTMEDTGRTAEDVAAINDGGLETVYEPGKEPVSTPVKAGVRDGIKDALLPTGEGGIGIDETDRILTGKSVNGHDFTRDYGDDSKWYDTGSKYSPERKAAFLSEGHSMDALKRMKATQGIRQLGNSDYAQDGDGNWNELSQGAVRDVLRTDDGQKSMAEVFEAADIGSDGPTSKGETEDAPTSAESVQAPAIAVDFQPHDEELLTPKPGSFMDADSKLFDFTGNNELPGSQFGEELVTNPEAGLEYRIDDQTRLKMNEDQWGDSIW